MPFLNFETYVLSKRIIANKTTINLRNVIFFYNVGKLNRHNKYRNILAEVIDNEQIAIKLLGVSMINVGIHSRFTKKRRHFTTGRYYIITIAII